MGTVARTVESPAVVVARRGAVRYVAPKPQVECPFCKGSYPDLSWHYAIGPNTCHELAAALDKEPRPDPNCLPCSRCGAKPRVRNRHLCSKCNAADALLYRLRKKK